MPLLVPGRCLREQTPPVQPRMSYGQVAQEPGLGRRSNLNCRAIYMMLLRPDVSDLVTREDTQTLIRATRHWRGRIRDEAAAALGALRTPNAVPELLRLLNDRQSEVREAAARALGDIGRTETVAPLIEALVALTATRMIVQTQQSTNSSDSGSTGKAEHPRRGRGCNRIGNGPIS